MFNWLTRKGKAKEDQSPSVDELKKEFKNELKAAAKGACHQLTPVTKVLCKIPENEHESTIFQNVRRSENCLQYAFNKKCYTLYLVMVKKIDARKYLTSYKLLEQAIQSRDDKQLQTILQAYHDADVLISLAKLSSKSMQELYEGSWNSDIVEKIYPHVSSYFIPRGQEKAKMYAYVCYITFDRNGAREEAGYIIRAFHESGFTVRPALINWTFTELIDFLNQHISQDKDDCSVIFICIMSHGGNGIIHDKDGNKGEVDDVQKVLTKLKPHIPAVSSWTSSSIEYFSDQIICSLSVAL